MSRADLHDEAEALAFDAFERRVDWSPTGDSELDATGASILLDLRESDVLERPTHGAVTGAHEDWVPPGTRLGDLRFGALLGSGRSGLTYSATSHGRKVAATVLAREVTEILPTLRSRVESLREVDHPNVVELLDVVSVRYAGNSRSILLMEEIDGVPAGDRLSRRGPLGRRRRRAQVSPGSLEGTAEALFSALGALHSTGLVHGDLGPSSVLVRPNGQVVLGGLVGEVALRRVDRRALEESASEPYCAPEVILEPSRRGASGDMFAAGALLYELWAGRPPFDSGLPALNFVRKQHSERPPRLRKVDPLLEPFATFILGSLRADPAERWRSAEEAARAWAGKATPRFSEEPAEDNLTVERSPGWFRRARRWLRETVTGGST